MKEIKATPTTEGFFKILITILKDSSSPSDRNYARIQLMKYAKRYDILTKISEIPRDGGNKNNLNYELLMHELKSITFD